MEKIDLYKLLQSNGITSADLCARLEINKSTLSRWHNFKVPDDRLIQLEQVTGIPRQHLRPDLFVGLKIEAA